MAKGHGWVVQRRAGEGGVADPWARGYNNVRVQSNGLKMFKIFQILIDLNLTFLSSKNLK
jgi:hypothetical protein